ncbi:MAG: MATE family efflux transporter [Bacteroidales bacterium]|nr:MATE family efflux transporter [Bacteroidales bacterium]
MTEEQLNAETALRYNDEKSKQLATRPVSKLLWQFATPSIIGMAASSIYNICDSIFIGRGVDPMAIAGLAITFPLMNISAAFGAMVGVGGGAQVSVAMGEGNQHKAIMIFGNVMRLDVTIGLLLTFFGLIFLDPILRLFGASDVTLPYARDYMQIILAGNVITHTFLGMNDQLRSTGNPKRAMQGQLIAVVANIVLDALFIFGFGWGMRGAALATILGQCCAWVHNARFFMDKKNYVHFSRSALILRMDIIKEILSIGLSPFFFQTCSCIVVILINRGLMEQGGAEGDSYVGVYGIVNRMAMLSVMLVMGFSQGMQPIVGFNMGARLFHRVTGVLKYAYACATAVMTFFFIIVMLFPAQLAACFTNDPHMMELCVPALRIVMCVFPFVGGQMITNSFFQSIRKAKKSIFLSTTRQMLFLVPLLVFLPKVFVANGENGVYGIWWSFAISDALSTILAVSLLIYQVRKLNRMSALTLAQAR